MWGCCWPGAARRNECDYIGYRGSIVPELELTASSERDIPPGGVGQKQDFSSSRMRDSSSIPISRSRSTPRNPTGMIICWAVGPLGAFVEFRRVRLSPWRVRSLPFCSDSRTPKIEVAADLGERFMSKLVAFGAAGRLGQRIVGEAASRGHEVTAVVRRSATAPCSADMVAVPPSTWTWRPGRPAMD